MRMVPFRLCHFDSPNFPSPKAAKAELASHRPLFGGLCAQHYIQCFPLLTSLAPHKSGKWVTLTAPVPQMRNRGCE